MRHQAMFIVFLLGVVAATAQEPTSGQMALPLQELLSVVNKEYKFLVADWMISIGRQHLEERRIRNRLKQDARFRQAFQDYLVECCEFAFTPNRKKINFPSVMEGNPEWAAELLVVQVPRDILLSAIVPQLDPGKRLHGILEGQDRDLARYLEFQVDSAAPIGFQAYVNYLWEHKKEPPPPGLIAYMIHKHPGEALHCLTDVFVDSINNTKELLWAEHVVANTLWKQKYGFIEKHEIEADSITQLNLLSKSLQWWVRLYVAEIMRQHAGFRQQKVVERLKEDEHPLVRETIAAFAKTGTTTRTDR